MSHLADMNIDHANNESDPRYITYICCVGISNFKIISLKKLCVYSVLEEIEVLKAILFSELDVTYSSR